MGTSQASDADWRRLENIISTYENPLSHLPVIRSPYTRKLDPHYRFGFIEQDPDDNKFVDCAIIANADYIVSGDSHFRVLEDIPFPRVGVISLFFYTSLNEFMEGLG